MQYSTNSNEAIRHTIRSCPTLAGQYRQANIQLRDRQQALRAYTLGTMKAKEEMEISLLRLEQHRKKRHRGIEDAIAQREAKVLAIEIQEKELALQDASDLEEDCRREIAVCQDEMERICREAGVDFAALPPADYQDHMTTDYQVKHARWLAAGVLSQQLRMPVDRCDALLELPEGDRLPRLRLMDDLVTGTLNDIALLQQERQQQLAQVQAQLAQLQQGESDGVD